MTVWHRFQIRDWPEQEQPLYKVRRDGAGSLSDAELLSSFFFSRTDGRDPVTLALEALVTHDGITGLARMSTEELGRLPGLDKEQAAHLHAALELGRRAIIAETDPRTQVKSAQDVSSLLEAQLRGLDQEELRVVLLSTRNHVLGTVMVYRGSINMSQVRVGEVFTAALKAGAASVIIAHNHPSGDPTPSPDDVRVTREIVQAGQLLGVDVLDHVIIGDAAHGWVSLRERRLGFE